MPWAITTGGLDLFLEPCGRPRGRWDEEAKTGLESEIVFSMALGFSFWRLGFEW